MCEVASALPVGTELTFFTTSEGSCVDDEGELFRIELAETSDVHVTVRALYDEEADPESIEERYDYSAFLRPDCDSAATAFPGQACTNWSPSSTWPGSPSRSYDAAHLAAGSYVLEIRGSVSWADSSVPLEMAVTVDATPSVVPECTSGAMLASGRTSGSTDGPDAFRFSCEHFLRGPPVFVDAPERTHRVLVTERERWRITARSEAPLRMALHDSCDPSLQPRECVESIHCNERSLDAILDPGEYFLRVEGRLGGEHDYELEVHREAPGASCTGARVVTTSGVVSGDTTGASDDFRASEPCGDGAGPDDVLRIDVGASGYFAADLVLAASFANAYLTLRDECGGAPIRQHNTGVSWTVDPGTYYLTIDGMTESDFGPYQVDITMP